MADLPHDDVRHGPGRGWSATSAVVAGSVVSGVAVYAFQAVAARTLGEADYAPLGVLWTIQSLVMATVLLAAETFVARESTDQGAGAGPVDAVVRRLGAWLLALAAAIGVVTWILREPLFHDVGWQLPTATVATVLTYGGFMLVRGRLAGTDRFGAYGAVTGVESCMRLGAAVPVAVLVPTTSAFGWVFPVGPAPVLAWWLIRGRRRTRVAGGVAAATGTSPPPEAIRSARPSSTGRYLAATGIANVAAQVLLAAGPLALVALRAPAAEISVFFVTLTLARVPMMLAFGGLLSRVLPPLTRLARAGEHHRLRRIVLVVAGVTPLVAGLAAGMAAGVGPALVRGLFGSGFDPAGWLVAALTAMVLVATAGLGLNQVLIALDLEVRTVAPWLGGLAVAVLVAGLAPGDPSSRVAMAVLAGAAAAFVGLVGSLLRPHPPSTQGSRTPTVRAHTDGGH
jgi:O-antigen/teichoic acid export membrane protein